MQRYFTKELDKQVTLSLEDSHHVKNVMRNRLGDQVELVAKGGAAIYEISSLDDLVRLNFLMELNEHKERLDITLVQGLVTDKKMSSIIQKATELGVKTVIPFAAERSVVKLKEGKLERWNKIAKEASEQSKRQYIPEVLEIVNLNELEKLNADIKILCSVNEKQMNLKALISKYKKNDSILIVIGPEGGFSDKEESSLLDNGFIKASLGSLVLRTETASSFVLSAINYHLMD